jgi:hypothetical protein
VRPLGQDLRDLLGLLDKHDVRYMVVGGFAVAAYGIPRYTKDLDVWLACSPENAVKVIAALDEFGFASLGLTVDDLAQPDVVIQLGYEPNRVDLLTGLSGVEFEDVYAKRVFTMIDGIQVPIIDRSSLIANKRALGRAQDLADAEALDR